MFLRWRSYSAFTALPTWGVLLDQKINNIFDHDTRSFSCTVNFGVAGFPLRKFCRQREKIIERNKHPYYTLNLEKIQ